MLNYIDTLKRTNEEMHAKLSEMANIQQQACFKYVCRFSIKNAS